MEKGESSCSRQNLCAQSDLLNQPGSFTVGIWGLSMGFGVNERLGGYHDRETGIKREAQ